MGAKRAVEPGVRGPRLTVLLVEDDCSVAAVTAEWLHRLGYEVIVCENGKKACDLACERTGRIDLLLADVMLPGMRGPVVAGAVRCRHPEMAVLFTSGYSPELVGEMFSPHLDTALLLYKPYTAEQLASRVQLALSRKAARPRPPAPVGPLGTD
jgi:CheY-like chemotaxis protein